MAGKKWLTDSATVASRKTDLTKEGYEQVLMGRTAVYTERDTNEIQEIQNALRKQIVQQTYMSGFLNLSTVTTGQTFIKFDKDQKVNIAGDLITIPAGTQINLPTAPTNGTREDLVFLEYWKEEVTFDATSPNYGLEGQTANGSFEDTRVTALAKDQTSRIARRFRLRTVSGADFTSFRDGMDVYDNAWKDNTLVMAQGANPSPITDSTILTSIRGFSSSYTRNRGDVGSEFKVFLTDVGVYIAGRGDQTSKDTLKTVDGYVYAIPLFRVPRRNSGGYSVANLNGAKLYVSTTTSVTREANTDWVFTVFDVSIFSIGDIVSLDNWNDPTNSKFKITAIDTTNKTLTLDPVPTAKPDKAWGYSIGSKISLVSDRPDSLYSNIIATTDIGATNDLRHDVTPKDFTKLLVQEFDRYMRGENGNKRMDKVQFNLQRAPLGLQQVVDANGVPNFVENLLPDFSKWTLHANAVMTSPYSFTLNATGTYQESSVMIPAVGNQLYTISENIPVNGEIRIYCQDSLGNTLLGVPFDSGSFTSFTTPSNTSKLYVVLRNGNVSSGTYTFTNPQLEVGNTANKFVPYGRWYTPADYLSGGTTFKLTESFNGHRKTMSDAQISETVTEVIEALSTPQRHVKVTQATAGQWTANDTIQVSSSYGVITGVIDSDTALARIVSNVSGSTTQFVVNDVSKLAVNDIIIFYKSSDNSTTGSTWTVTAIDTTNKIVTVDRDVSTDLVGSGWTHIIETTASSSSPVTTATGLVGTWSGLGTKTATFTISTAPTTNTDSIVLQYSVNYPAGKGIPNVVTDLLQAEVNGQKLVNGTTVSVKANFNGKISGNTDLIPHMFSNSWGSTLNPPNDTTNSSEIPSTEYTSLYSLDGTTEPVSTSVNGSKAQQRMSFNLIRLLEDKYGDQVFAGCLTVADKVAWLKANITNINCDWYGYGSSPSGNKARLSEWSVGASTWIDGSSSPTHSNNYVSKLSTSSSYGNALANLIDSNGLVYFLACADPSDGTTASTLYTDYVELSINLNVAETGYTVFQPDNAFPILSENLLTANQAFPIDVVDFALYGSVSSPTVSALVESLGVIKVTNNNASAQSISINNNLNRVSVTPNTYYTFSALAKATSGSTLKFSMYFYDSAGAYISGGLGSNVVSLIASGGYDRGIVSMKAPSNASTCYVDVAVPNSNSGDSFWYTQAKLEKGNNPSPTWSSGRSKKKVLNFLGKVAGDITQNPHKSGRLNSATFPSPDFVNFAENVTSTVFDQISKLDGSIYTYSTANNTMYAQQLFEFDLSHLGMSLSQLKSALRKLTVNWTGYGYGSNGGTGTYGATVKWWDYSTSSWYASTSNTTSSPSTLFVNDVQNKWITKDQKFYVLVHSTYPSNGTIQSQINTDYINLVVELADYVDYVKSNIVKVRPSTKEVKLAFSTKSYKHIGNGGDYDEVALWYKHVPVPAKLATSEYVTILAEGDGFLASDLGSNVGHLQGTHQYLNPLYRVNNERTETFGDFGFGKVPFAEDSKNVNTGAKVYVNGSGYSLYATSQYAIPVMKKPMVGIARYLVLHNGEIKLMIVSSYRYTGNLDVSSGSNILLLVPICGRPIPIVYEGVTRTTISNPTAWKTPTEEVEGYMKPDGTIVATYQ